MTTIAEKPEVKKTDIVLRTLQQADLLPLFTAAGILPLLDRIEEEALAYTFDADTAAGREEIKRLAYAVARAKTTIDSAGKNLVADWKQKAGKVDEARRLVRERLDALKEEVRQPVTDWEAAEHSRAEKTKLEFEIELAWNNAIEEDELRTLRAEKERREAAERERLDAERNAEEEKRREQERIEREERIRHKAEEDAERRIADAKAEAERDAEDAKERARLEKEKAVADERKRVEDEARREREQRERDEKAKRDAEEENRLKEERRVAHKAHRAKIHREVEASLIETNMLDDCLATALTQAIARGEIKHLKIIY